MRFELLNGLYRAVGREDVYIKPVVGKFAENAAFGAKVERCNAETGTILACGLKNRALNGEGLAGKALLVEKVGLFAAHVSDIVVPGETLPGACPGQSVFIA